MRPLQLVAMFLLGSLAPLLAGAQQPSADTHQALPKGEGGPPQLVGFGQPPEMNPTAPKVLPPIDPKLKAWDGIWTPVGPLPGANGSGVPWTAEWQRHLAEYKAKAGTKDDRSDWALCVPQGPPLMMSGTFDLVVHHGALNIFTMAHGFESRHVYVDGRQHTPDEYLFNTYGGESVGHWQGDTLVVDTTALNSTNEITPGVAGSAMHVVERYRLRADGLLQIQFVIEDPQALSAPWRYTRVYRRSDLPGLPEHYCVLAPRPDDPDALKALGRKPGH